MNGVKVFADRLKQGADNEDVVEDGQADKDAVEDGGQLLAQQDGYRDKVSRQSSQAYDGLKQRVFNFIVNLTYFFKLLPIIVGPRFIN